MPYSWLGITFLLLVPVLAGYLTTWLMVDTDASNASYALLKETMVFTLIFSLPFILLGLSLYCEWVPKDFVTKEVERANGETTMVGSHALVLKYWIITYASDIIIVWMMDLVTVFFHHQIRKDDPKSETKFASSSEAA